MKWRGWLEKRFTIASSGRKLSAGFRKKKGCCAAQHIDDLSFLSHVCISPSVHERSYL